MTQSNQGVTQAVFELAFKASVATASEDGFFGEMNKKMPLRPIVPKGLHSKFDQSLISTRSILWRLGAAMDISGLD